MLKLKPSPVPPLPDEIILARKRANLSQTDAGVLVYSALRTWQQWEAGDRNMHPGLWELFNIKTAALSQDIKSTK